MRGLVALWGQEVRLGLRNRWVLAATGLLALLVVLSV